MEKIKNKKLIRVFAITYLLLLLLPNRASGQLFSIGGIVSNAISDIANFVFEFVLNPIASFLLYLGANLVVIMFSLNNMIMEMPVIEVMWRIVRDVANLGFTIALIIAAFTTILKIENYNIQKMLPKIIAAAILVNFSLTIAGFIVDFSNVITKFFLDRSLFSQSSGNLAEAFGNALNPQKLYGLNHTNLMENSGFINQRSGNQNALLTLFSLFSVFILIIMMAILLLAFSAMLITRFAYLVVLLGLSPLPWLLDIIPVKELKSVAPNWWSNFIKWSFTSPILAFFIYITLRTALGMKDVIQEMGITEDTFTGIEDFFVQLTNTIVIASLLAAGLSSSQAIGGKLAAGVVGLNNKLQGGLKKIPTGAYGKLSDTGRKILTAGAKKDPDGKSWAEKAGESKFAKIPIIGAAFRGIAAASVKAKEETKAGSLKAQEKYKDLSVDTLVNRIESQIVTKRTGIGITNDDLGAVMALAKKGGWEKLDPKTREVFKKEFKRVGLVKELAKFDPLAAIEAGMSAEKAAAAVENIPQLSKEAIKKLAPYFTEYQRRELAMKGTIDKKEAFVEGLDEALSAIKLKGGEEIKEEGKNKIKEDVKKLINLMHERKRALNKILKDYEIAKDKQDKALIENLSQEKEKITKEIKEIESTIIKGGEITIGESNLVDATGKPITETIKIPEVDPSEIPKRKEILNKRKTLSKQAIWQDIINKENEETQEEEITELE